jgi:hypothetical protein
MRIPRSHFPIGYRTQAGVIVVLALGLALSAQAQAQTLRNAGTDRAQVDLGFIGNVRNSIMLTVLGTGSTVLTNGASVGMPVHATATIDFGAFSTILRPGPATGLGYRVTLPSPGAVVAATLAAMVTYNGAPTAALTISRLSPAGGLPDLPLSDLRVASPALVSWTAGTNGAQVPDAGLPGFNLCTAAGDLTCETGKPYPHSLAVFIPDSRPAGPFTTVVVYQGTMP